MVFLTWFLKVNETINVLIYGSLLILLAFGKASNLILVIVTVFSVAGNHSPQFLEWFDNLYLKIFNTNISALNEYHTFLYIVMYVFLGVILLIRAIRNKNKLNGKLLLPMTLMLSYSLLSLIWANNTADGLSEFWFIFQGYFVYMLIRNDNETKDKYLTISWFLSLLLLVISLQYFVSYGQNSDYNFFNFWRVNGKSAIKLWANPNVIAALLGIAITPSLYKYFAKDRNKLSYLFLPLESLIVYALILTNSQGFYYSLLVGAAFIPLLLIKNRKVLFGLIGGAILLFATGMAFVVYSEDIYPELYQMFNEFTTSRIEIYKEALLLLRKPTTLLFGLGMGADRSLIEAHFFHSWVFQVLITRGLVGFSLVAVMIYQAVSIMFDNKDRFRYFLAIAAIIYLSHGITDSGYDYQHIGVVYYLMLATLEKRIDTSQYMRLEEKGHLVQN